MVANGLTTVPAGLPGIARILGLAESAESVSNLDIAIVRLCSKIVAINQKLTCLEPSDLARSVGSDPSSIIFNGEFYQDFDEFLGKANRNNLFELLLLNSRRLFEFSKESTISNSSVALNLWNYKLGQEIIAPDQTSDILNGKKNELKLQKELSKFLVERGILSFGRTFGRSQIDLYTKIGPKNELVIEVKVYKKSPTESIIRSHVTQLLSYMDQTLQAQGVLVLYNCTNDLIIAPRCWLKGRIWILAINIGSAPPSGRNRSLVIRDSKDSKELFLIIENGIARKNLTTKKKRK